MGNNQLTKKSKPNVHIVMMQMNVRQVIKNFGEKGNESLLNN